MVELTVKIPDSLKDKSAKIEREIEELVSAEEKIRLLSLFIDETMRGAKQLPNSELVALGRSLKKGRSGKLGQTGLT